jgi:histidine triad (HIT) family protein
MGCVVCSLLQDDISANWVAQEEHAAAFLPLPTSSLAPGHTLVVPRLHTPGIHDVDPVSLMATMALVQKVSLALREALGAPGVNLLSASGPGSEQSVPHLHFHVVPRWEDDGFTTWPAQHSSRMMSGNPAQLLAGAIRTVGVRGSDGPRD